MDREIESMVGACSTCLENAGNPSRSMLHPWERATRPWSRVHVDHAGPFLGRLFFIVVDSFTKWVDVYPVASTSAELVIEKLRQSFAVQGLPDIVVSDNGSCFTSGQFKSFLEVNRIRHITSAPYHPSSNG